VKGGLKVDETVIAGRESESAMRSGGASAVKEPGHFEVRKSSS